MMMYNEKFFQPFKKAYYEEFLPQLRGFFDALFNRVGLPQLLYEKYSKDLESVIFSLSSDREVLEFYYGWCGALLASSEGSTGLGFTA